MYPSAFSYHTPASVEEAIGLLQEHGVDAKLLAGGHSLLPTMKLRLATPAHVVDMKGLRGSLQYIRDEGDAVAVGALTTHHMIETSDHLKQKAPVLVHTARHVGDLQVRNLGTIGGSVAHADPAGDFPAAILASETEMVAQGPNGRRTIPAAEFFFGFFETALEEGEILVELRVPVSRGGSSYQKFRHPASGYAVCGVAVVFEKEGDTVKKARVGVTGISDGAYRATGVEEALAGQSFSPELAATAAEGAADGVDPLEDTFAGADYRRQLAKIYTKRALLEAWERAG